MVSRLPARLDRDLDRHARRAGRPTIAGALATGFVATGTVIIDLVYGGHPTVLAYVAVSVLVFFICPTLVVEALRHRLAVGSWALDQQRQRDEASPPSPNPARRRTASMGAGRPTPIESARPTTQRKLRRGNEVEP